ncbi:MAG TPA: D-alanyl-D-alanine carboxypeptidase/D-alanyl-D-alanine-endopeptidase [Albidovulum sp.]|uniref:D-alanyl-D-alanine carboxypeptidase/D-alanyl-D-alanine endopeptidase n=1 Tax=Albidovulum sp. TaxID=1872424 RepID=UPI002C9DD1B2|nr:D-alanyl-D-alanine carboxypeptidase/D-alanyl-D-alanine-endopeptidase [Albidovulum sp.]
MAELTRRGVLAGFMAAGAMPVWAEAPLRSPVPPARPVRTVGGVAAAADAIIAEAKLGGEVAYVVADAATGAVLEARGGGREMPPASTAKVITTLYALEKLGGGYRFTTRLIATGPVSGGTLQGDLILAGGGDPTLDTDDLGDMARALAAAGVRGISGAFRVWAGALPYLASIDAGQPVWLGYNPAVSGLNLNFNRVNFVWKRNGNGYDVGMDARAERFAPPVYSATVAVADRDLPIYSYRDGKTEDWTVARPALGKGGSRWLPVRRPELYAGDVFQTLARAEGVPLPAPVVAEALPVGTDLVRHESDDLRTILREMMKFSTNMTAEAVGMMASAQAGINDHVASGRAMADWLALALGTGPVPLVDHSGLSGASRMTPDEMVRALVTMGPKAGLRGLLKEIPMLDAKGRRIPGSPIRVDAKTGTLNFVSTLAGYVSAPGGRELAFAIFTGDVPRRDAVPDDQKEQPPGVVAWVRRSKRLQQQLIERWAAVYGA